MLFSSYPSRRILDTSSEQLDAFPGIENCRSGKNLCLGQMVALAKLHFDGSVENVVIAYQKYGGRNHRDEDEY